MTVKRVGARIEIQNLGTLRLFREDMEDIAKAMAELGPLMITCDETYTASEAKDFAELPKRPQSLSFHSAAENGQKIEVEFSKNVARAVLTEPETLCHGIFSRIDSIVKRSGRRRIPYRYRAVPGLLISAVGMVYLLLWVPVVPKGVPIVWPQGYIAIILALISSVTMVFTVWDSRFRRNNVILVNAYKSDRPSFWRRTRDDWVVEFIVGLAFLVLGYILGKVAG